MKFLKMHGLGNDFVVLDHRQGGQSLSDAQITHICDRHRGVGCDQLVVMQPSSTADFKVLFYNGDASESGACGNASRCVADIVMNEKGLEACRFETRAGVLNARRAQGGLVEVDMGPPRLEWRDIPLSQEVDTLFLPLELPSPSPVLAGSDTLSQREREGARDSGKGEGLQPSAVSMGNPHCVFFVPDLNAVDIPKWGPFFEHHELFPQRTNVEFVQIHTPTSVRLRTWERGAGLTLACGSAACATVVAGVRRGVLERKITAMLDGGVLHLEWRENDGHVLMTGPVAYVFEGILPV